MNHNKSDPFELIRQKDRDREREMQKTTVQSSHVLILSLRVYCKYSRLCHSLGRVFKVTQSDVSVTLQV